MTEKLSPERAIRLLRAKAGELEADAKTSLRRDARNSIAYLTADIALIAGLLADFMERSPGPSGPELGEDIDDANVRDQREWGAGG